MTQPIDPSLRRPSLPDPNTDPAMGPAVRSPTATAQQQIDVSALPAPNRSLRTFLANQPQPTAVAAPAPAAATVSPAQARLQAFMDAYSGPYVVDGKTVKAPAQFRMAGGFNDGAAGRSKELVDICRQAKAPDPTRCLGGYPTPSQLVKVTQALIDAGKLPTGPGDVATRIKTMQWNSGIGVDCTDYVAPAAMKAAGANVAWTPGTDLFRNADKNPSLTKVTLADARPGDVFCLDPQNGDAGHRAVVYSATVCSPAKAAELVAKYPAARDFLAAGPVRLLEVDSSWGAGNGSANGGVGRNTWLYNESTQSWAQLKPLLSDPPNSPPAFQLTPKGPYNEAIQGIYRFKGATS
jgi:hypothetical protein